jgi:alginate lyase
MRLPLRNRRLFEQRLPYWLFLAVVGASGFLDDRAGAADGPLALSVDPGGTLSLSLQPVQPFQPPLKLQVSTNLADFVDWTLVTNSAARYFLSDADMTNLPQRFFRLQLPELNLTNWSLTLPLDTIRPGIADEVLMPTLATFRLPPYFDTNSTGNGFVFYAPCGGATTQGSQYPRCELREMARLGLERASWTTTNGIHSMEIIQAVTHLPDVKPQIVVGQIHNASSAVLTFRLQDQNLLIDRVGVKTQLTTNQYTLGDVFSAKFLVHDGTVDCFFNGQYVRTFPVLETGCYFKAGCYTQSNTNKGDAPTAYGQVQIFGVSVSHDPPL